MPDGLAGFLANDIGQRDGPGEPVVNQDKDDGLSLPAQFLKARVFHADALVTQVAGTDDFYLVSFHLAGGPLAGDRPEFFDRPGLF